MRRTFTICGKLILWGTLVVLLVGAAALVLVTRHLDEAVRTEVQRLFAEHYQGLHVAVRSAHRVEGQGLFIRGLSVKDPSLEGPQSELLYVDEMFLACRSGLDQLVLGDVQVQHLTLRRLALRAVRRADGSWSVARLVPLPSFGDGMPTAAIEDGTIEVFDPQRNPPASLTLRRINVEVQPRQLEGGSRGVLYVAGTVGSDIFHQLELTGWLDPADGRWHVGGAAQHLVVAPETRQMLPDSIARHTAALGNLRGKANLRFDVSNEPAGEIPYRFEISGQLYEARFEDPRLPFPLTDVAAQVQLSNAGVQIEQLTARGGNAALSLSLVRQGWSGDSPLQLQAHARRLQFDRRMVQVLPRELVAIWSRFQPTGLLDADVTLEFDGEHWQPQLKIGCLDVAFRCEEFPYPFTGSTGTIALQDDVLTLALRTMAGAQGLRLEGRIENPFDTATGWFEFACDGPIPIDQQLLAALGTSKLSAARDLLDSLGASGNLTAWGRFERLRADQAGVNEHVVLRVADASVAYEKFPYPLHRISGEVEVWNGQWTFRQFQGRGGSGRVACNGSFTSGGDGPLLALELVATDVPLEEELRLAFPPDVQRAWADLRPRGTIDHVALQVKYRPQQEQFEVSAIARKGPERPEATGQSISVYPRAFAYRLDQVEGELRYRDGYLSIPELKAEHGGARLRTSGSCELADDGGWRLRLSPLQAAGLTMDRDLLAALPEELAAGLAPLNVSGPLALEGGIEFRHSGRAADAVSADWDLTLDMENGQLQCGVDLNHIHGSVRLVGASTAAGFYSQGELAIDSLMYEGFQFTGISGPVWIDRQRVSLGAWAEQPRSDRPPRRIRARILGGEVAGDIHVALDGVQRFTLQGQLDGADLALFAREFLPRERQISGQANGTLRISGDVRGRDTLRGEGRLWLRNADLYELPLMAKVVKILKVKPLANPAFSSADIEFRVMGEDVYLDRIVLNSDAVRLKGAGEVNLDRRVNLKLYTLVGDESRRIPVVWPLLADASRRILMIEVTGSLDDPVTNRHVLPGLNSTIQQLFSEELGLAPAGAARR